MKSNIKTRLVSFVLSFIFLFSLAGCTRNKADDLKETPSETPSVTAAPEPNSVESASIDNNVINPIDSISKLGQIISIDEVKLTKSDYKAYKSATEYYGMPEGLNNKFNYKIMYKSGDCEVAGYISIPADYSEKNYPILIFNRGGQRDFSKISPVMLCLFADMGFIAIASQYRGTDGGTGKDDFGGANVQDILSLIDIAEQFPIGNGKIYMFGFSRGGLQTYCALKEENLADKDRISAAAVCSGVSDLREIYNSRQQGMKNMLTELVGGTPEQIPDEYEKRSAVCWPELINTPLLICHGRSDWRAPVDQAETMYDKLKKLDKNVELKLYDGGHELTSESFKYVFQWLLSH